MGNRYEVIIVSGTDRVDLWGQWNGFPKYVIPFLVLSAVASHAFYDTGYPLYKSQVSALRFSPGKVANVMILLEQMIRNKRSGDIPDLMPRGNIDNASNIYVVRLGKEEIKSKRIWKIQHFSVVRVLHKLGLSFGDLPLVRTLLTSDQMRPDREVVIHLPDEGEFPKIEIEGLSRDEIGTIVGGLERLTKVDGLDRDALQEMILYLERRYLKGVRKSPKDENSRGTEVLT